MMRMNKKSLLVIGLMLCIAGMGLGTYAAYTVTSGTTHVSIQYSVSIYSTSTSGDAITITAQVLDHSSGVSGQTVKFYETNDGGATWNYIGSNGPTNPSGLVQLIWNAPANGEYDFKATWDIGP